MAAFLKDLLQGSKPSASAAPVGDSDFADFAGAPDPSPASFSAIPSAAGFTGLTATPTGPAVPYTKWYNVHERHSLSDFKQEGVIFIFMVLIIAVHVWGTRTNRAKAKAWLAAHGPALQKEFALVGFGGHRLIRRGDIKTADEIEIVDSAKAMTSEELGSPVQPMKEKSPCEFASYATGRQNVAFADINLTMQKRYNPLSIFAEFALSFAFDSMPAPVERVETVMYPFDGKEALTVPGQLPGAHELRNRDTKSSYDGFVWAIVNKDRMKQLRDERYDVSITTTKDNAKLPNWATVMSESAEVTDLLLTPDLVKAVEQAGEVFDHLIISDQPLDKPTTLNETEPKKRLYLSMRLPSSSAAYNDSIPLFSYFLRLPDMLVQSAHFRPEVMRKVRTTREDAIRQLQKADEKEKVEEREIEREKAKRMKRELELKGLDAKAQKKYLEKEKEKEQRKMQKKQSQRQ